MSDQTADTESIRAQVTAAQARWKTAANFQDLCELTAEFIGGKLPFHPNYGPCVDKETGPLVPYLVALNRAGFLTTCSQPGEDFPDWKQRSCVDGYALEPVARRIARMSLYTDLHVVVVPPGQEAGFHTPVILSDFQPHGWSGFCRVSAVDEFEDGCGGAPAVLALEEAWSVSVVDLVWGREEHLWRELARELCYSERPHPDLGLDADTTFAV